jgi:hypothetical protein
MQQPDQSDIIMRNRIVAQRIGISKGVCVLGLALSVQMFSNTAFAESPSLLHKFVGDWSCKGSFVSNGAPIAGDLSMQFDERSGALIVHHDDVAPGAYHALEVWMVTPMNSRTRRCRFNGR